MNFIDAALASAGAVENTEAASQAGQGVLASLGLNPTLFIFQLINFAVVAVILWFLILKPLTKKMVERQKLIDESLTKAEKIDQELKKIDSIQREKLREAKAEAEKVLERARANSDKISAAMKIEAEKRVNAALADAKKRIGEAKEEMLKELKGEMADLVGLSLEKILKEKINEDKDKKLIDDAVKSIK